MFCENGREVILIGFVDMGEDADNLNILNNSPHMCYSFFISRHEWFQISISLFRGQKCICFLASSSNVKSLWI